MIEKIHIKEGQTLTSMATSFYNNNSLLELIIEDCPNVTDLSDLVGDCYNLETVTFDDNTALVINSLENMFYACYALNTIDIDFSSRDMTTVTSIRGMFSDCIELTPLTLPVFDTSNITNADYTWRGCTSLTSFPTYDLSSVTSFREAWRSCISLTSFPLLDFSSGKDFYYAWYNCNSLTSFPQISTAGITTSDYNALERTWGDCITLTSFPELDYSQVKRLYYTWNGCSGLTSFPTTAMDLGNITTADSYNDGMTGTWAYCSSLESVDFQGVPIGIVKWSFTFSNCDQMTCAGTFPKMHNAYAMFTACGALTDIRYINTTSSTYSFYMFNGAGGNSGTNPTAVERSALADYSAGGAVYSNPSAPCGMPPP